MVDFLLRVLWETWSILEEASIFLLLGFALAGALRVLVPRTKLIQLVGRGRVRSVLWGAAIGAPLPLCSCGVLPTALGALRQGATPGATVAFLIATPETGADSIGLSYALTDPIMTLFRPFSGVVTAVAAGLATNFLGVRPRSGSGMSPDLLCNSSDQSRHGDHAHDGPTEHDHLCSDLFHTERPSVHNAVNGLATIAHKANRIFQYGLRELLDETSHWLILGFLLSGIMAAILPSDFFERYLAGGVTSMLAMLFISMPIYTCASSSTPLAAAMVMKGLNPGAALVFLLAGPATNLGNLVVLLRFLGPRIVVTYLATTAASALLAGYALNGLYRALAVDPRASFGSASEYLPQDVKLAGGIVLAALLVHSVWRTPAPTEWLWLRAYIAALTGLWLTRMRIGIAGIIAAAALYIGSGLFAVEPGSVGVKLRLGEVVAAALPPGLHYRLPWPIETDIVVRTELVRRIEFGLVQTGNRDQAGMTVGREHMSAGGYPTSEALNVTGTWYQREPSPEPPFLLTGDRNLIDLRSAIQYRVKDPLAFAFNVADPRRLVRSATLTALRGVIATTGIDPIYTSERKYVEDQVAQIVQRNLDNVQAGIDIVSFCLLYVHPPDAVHDAFRDVASAQEDKLRTINRAGIFAVEKVNQAKGEAAAMIEQANGFRDQQIRRAQGDGAGFAARLEAYRRAPELTRFRLEMENIEEALPDVNKYVRPGAGETKDFDLWLMKTPGSSGAK